MFKLYYEFVIHWKSIHQAGSAKECLRTGQGISTDVDWRKGFNWLVYARTASTRIWTILSFPLSLPSTWDGWRDGSSGSGCKGHHKNNQIYLNENYFFLHLWFWFRVLESSSIDEYLKFPSNEVIQFPRYFPANTRLGHLFMQNHFNSMLFNKYVCIHGIRLRKGDYKSYWFRPESERTNNNWHWGRNYYKLTVIFWCSQGFYLLNWKVGRVVGAGNRKCASRKNDQMDGKWKINI